jgi:predicted RNase H-like HicB family nuclease
MIQRYSDYQRQPQIGYDKADYVKIDGIEKFPAVREKDFLALPTATSTSTGNPFLNPCVVQIHTLVSRKLSKPIDVIIEPDDGGFIARNPDLPLYGFGDDRCEAIEMLKLEIETLYFDLNEDDNITDSWVLIKAFLNGIIE